MTDVKHDDPYVEYLRQGLIATNAFYDFFPERDWPPAHDLHNFSGWESYYLYWHPRTHAHSGGTPFMALTRPAWESQQRMEDAVVGKCANCGRAWLRGMTICKCAASTIAAITPADIDAIKRMAGTDGFKTPDYKPERTLTDKQQQIGEAIDRAVQNICQGNGILGAYRMGINQ